MARPLDIDIKIPLQASGWVQLKVRVDDIASLDQGDQTFLLELLERFHVFTSEMLKCGLTGPPRKEDDRFHDGTG